MSGHHALGVDREQGREDVDLSERFAGRFVNMCVDEVDPMPFLVVFTVPIGGSQPQDTVRIQADQFLKFVKSRVTLEGYFRYAPYMIIPGRLVFKSESEKKKIESP